MNKRTITHIVLLVVIINFLSQGRGETNKVVSLKSVASNNSTTNRPSWSVKYTACEGSTDTNGLSCNLRVENDQGNPLCTIDINNKSTNAFLKCWNIYRVAYLKIDLLDSEGKLIDKTELGKQCGTIPDQQQWEVLAHDRRVEWSSGQARTPGLGVLVAKQDHQYGTHFYISDLFELKRAGEYTLRVQIPLVQLVGSKFQITWLPEIAGKIQIRSSDAPK